MPPPEHSERRTVVQREEDREALEALARAVLWIRRGPRLAVLLMGITAGAGGAGAFIGTQGGDVTRADVDAIQARLGALEGARESVDGKLDLLLAINCPQITRPDLVRECRDRGIPR
jgi:hypothetical protein